MTQATHARQAESAATQPAVDRSLTEIEPPSDPRTRGRHSEPALHLPPSHIEPSDSLFPQTLRPLQPYLQMANKFGTNALKPGALIDSDPMSSAAQDVKTALSKIGLRYSFDQNIVMSAQSNRVQGDSVIGAYAHDIFANWTIFQGDELGGTSGWITWKSVGATGLGVDLHEQNPRKNIGAAVSPNNNYHSQNFGIEQCAWAQSFADGRFVAMIGQVNQTNYLDINRYANTAHGQFMNAALVNSMVLPAPGNNLGINLQWQPYEHFYAMFGVGPNNQDLGQNPWRDVSSDNVSYVGEFGFVLHDVGGLGPGTYRVQPFLATAQGELGGGVGFNLDQQLGKESPLGVFARAGFGDDDTASVPGAVKSQVSAGLALLSPFQSSGMFSQPNDDFAGVGFVWTQPSDSPSLDHEDEYALELTCAIQLTPTSTLQPDLQFVWDPANNPDGGPSTVFQIQLNIAW